MAARAALLERREALLQQRRERRAAGGVGSPRSARKGAPEAAPGAALLARRYGRTHSAEPN